jgi:hypothetical protein
VKAPGHTTQEAAADTFIVRIGAVSAGTIAEDGEYPGLWGAWDQDGQFMGRHASREGVAAFLASCFIVDEQDWS